MSDTAFQTKYRQEFIAGFEKRQSVLRSTVVTEADVNGKEAVFLVADSGSAEAVTRGVNGDIPTRPDNLNQYTATLQEWHDVPERTNFNIYASQGEGRKIMQQTSMAVVNRKIDADIYGALSAATLTWGAAATITIKRLLQAKAKLVGNFANSDAPVYAAITPAMHGALSEIEGFASGDFVTEKPYTKDIAIETFRYLGINFIVDGGLPNAGADTAVGYMWSRNAIGHACDSASIKTEVGYDNKNDKSWARCSTYMGSKLLQNSGVIKLPHTDATWLAS